MRTVNSLRGLNRYLAWVAIGLVIGVVLALVDHQLEPGQPIYALVVIGVVSGVAQAFTLERANKRQRS